MHSLCGLEPGPGPFARIATRIFGFQNLPKYLFKKIRDFVPEAYKDGLYPPSDPWLDSRLGYLALGFSKSNARSVPRFFFQHLGHVLFFLCFSSPARVAFGWKPKKKNWGSQNQSCWPQVSCAQHLHVALALKSCVDVAISSRLLRGGRRTFSFSVVGWR